MMDAPDRARPPADRPRRLAASGTRPSSCATPATAPRWSGSAGDRMFAGSGFSFDDAARAAGDADGLRVAADGDHLRRRPARRRRLPGGALARAADPRGHLGGGLRRPRLRARARRRRSRPSRAEAERLGAVAFETLAAAIARRAGRPGAGAARRAGRARVDRPRRGPDCRRREAMCGCALEILGHTYYAHSYDPQHLPTQSPRLGRAPRTARSSALAVAGAAFQASALARPRRRFVLVADARLRHLPRPGRRRGPRPRARHRRRGRGPHRPHPDRAARRHPATSPPGATTSSAIGLDERVAVDPVAARYPEHALRERALDEPQGAPGGVASAHGVPQPRSHGHAGQPALPRRDDVRRLGQPRPRRVDPDHPRRRSTPGSTSSTPPTSTRAASRRRSSARRWPAAAATTSSSPPRSTARWATTRTSSATRAAGSSRRSTHSLKRLQTDWIDLYQIHRPEPDTDIDETLGALTDLVRAGKVRYIGSSTFPAVGDRRGAVGRRAPRPRALHAASSRRTRCSCAAIENDVLPTCTRYGMGVIPWSPLAGGWLSGRWRKGQDAPESTRAQRLPDRYDLSKPENQRKLDAVEELAQLADDSGAHADRARARVRDPPPGGDGRDHRAAHDGAARVPAAGGGRRALRRRAGPDRRDRPARHQRQPRRRAAGRTRRCSPRRAGAETEV